MNKVILTISGMRGRWEITWSVGGMRDAVRWDLDDEDEDGFCNPRTFSTKSAAQSFLDSIVPDADWIRAAVSQHQKHVQWQADRAEAEAKRLRDLAMTLETAECELLAEIA